MYNNNNFKIFSTEVSTSIIKSAEIANYNKIEPLHLLYSIFSTENLISTLIDIRLFNNLNISIQNFNNNTYNNFINNLFKINFSISSLILISKLLKFNKMITSLDLLNILINSNIKYINILSKMVKVYKLAFLKNIFTTEPLIILKEFSYYIHYNNYNNVLGRSLEINLVQEVLLNKFNRNPILVGSSGIGKFSIIKGVYLKLLSKENNLIYMLNFNTLKIFFETGNYETNRNNLINWLLEHQDITIIALNLDYYNNEVIINLYNILYPLLKVNLCKLICSISKVSFVDNFIKENIIDPLIFKILNITEPIEEDTLNILRLKAIELSNYHDIIIAEYIIQKVINLTKLFLKNKLFPIKGIFILDNACVLSKTQNNNNNLIEIFIHKAISLETNISLNIITKNSSKNIGIKNLEILLQQRIFGQPTIIKKIANSIKRALSGIKTPDKPIGSWLLCGPSGTGKTELAKALATLLLGTEADLIRFDMSEYMEKHSVSKLIGSPPGYVGYEEKGQLTEAVNKKPYCILLFDEIEKAHESISNIMLQILDDGRLTDSTGKVIKFSETIILFTSNLGCSKNIKDFKSYKTKQNTMIYKLEEYKIHRAIKNYFKPEFINRLQDILIFQPLNNVVLLSIINKFIDQFKQQLKNLEIPITFIIEDNFKNFLSNLSNSPLYGARPLKRLLDELIADPIIEILLKLEITTSFICIYTLKPEKNIISYTILTT